MSWEYGIHEELITKLAIIHFIEMLEIHTTLHMKGNSDQVTDEFFSNST